MGMDPDSDLPLVDTVQHGDNLPFSLKRSGFKQSEVIVCLRPRVKASFDLNHWPAFIEKIRPLARRAALNRPIAKQGQAFNGGSIFDRLLVLTLKMEFHLKKGSVI